MSTFILVHQVYVCVDAFIRLLITILNAGLFPAG